MIIFMACCYAVQLVMGVSSAPVLREEASSSRRSFEDLVRLPLAPLTLQRARPSPAPHCTGWACASEERASRSRLHRRQTKS